MIPHNCPIKNELILNSSQTLNQLTSILNLPVLELDHLEVSIATLLLGEIENEVPLVDPLLLDTLIVYKGASKLCSVCVLLKLGVLEVVWSESEV